MVKRAHLQDQLLHNLNDAQLKAVTHKEGPLMIIAGAGTGKTTVITHRIAWLIEQRLAKPEEILALTFTDKAAGEMEERVDRLLPIGYVDMWISTFHAFCERILRQHAVEIGLPVDFELLDEVQTLLLMRRNLDRFKLDYYRPRGNPTRFVRALLQHFSRAKDEHISPEEYLAHAKDLQLNVDSAEGVAAEVDGGEMNETARILELADAYHTYQQLLLDHNALDFADLIFYTLELFRTRPTILKHYQNQFKFVLVDEFQDTNLAQYELVKLLVASPHNLTVVGDDDQSIYKFRGASLSNILLFREDYPKAETVVLTKNYRSLSSILDHAYRLIQNNNPHRLESSEQLNKELEAVRDEKGRVEHLVCESLEDEVNAVLERIAALRNEQQCPWSDFCILVRANDHAEPFVRALERAGVPNRFLARSGLYTKPLIIDVLAWMRVILLPHDGPSLYRILSHPELGINETDLASLNMYARRKGCSLYNSLGVAPEVSAQARKRLHEIQTLLRTLSQKAKRARTSELFVELMEKTGLLGWVQMQSDLAARELFSELNQFYRRIKAFETRTDDKTLTRFLEEFEHERQAGEVGDLSGDPEEGPDVVSIMTVHSSKGLEFRFVFLVNLIEQRFPSRGRAEAIPIPDALIKERAHGEGDPHIEEERRLFYVALTRARDAAFLLSSEDYGGKRARKPSRFLEELHVESVVLPKRTDILGANEGSLDVPFDPDTTSIPPSSAQGNAHTPSKVSFTQLAAFTSCPLQYKFAHILRVPVFGKHQFSFGKTMHNTLHQFLSSMANGAISQASLFAEPQEEKRLALPGLDHLLRLYESCWIDEWYPNEVIRDEYRTKGAESLKAYYAFLASTKPTIAYLEKDFSLKIGSVTVKGRIDRIDEIEGGFEIIDYKTGSPKTSEKLSWEDRRQLILYAIAAEKCFDPPLKIVKLSYHYLEDASVVSFEPTEKDCEKLEQEILTTVEKIKTSDFAPTPGFHCQFCDFKDICEFSQA